MYSNLVGGPAHDQRASTSWRRWLHYFMVSSATPGHALELRQRHDDALREEVSPLLAAMPEAGGRSLCWERATCRGVIRAEVAFFVLSDGI